MSTDFISQIDYGEPGLGVPKPPTGVSYTDWLKFLTMIGKELASKSQEEYFKYINLISSYHNKEMPSDLLTNYASIATGVNLDLYANNPSGLVNFYFKKISEKSTIDITKILGIGLMIGALVLLVILVFKA